MVLHAQIVCHACDVFYYGKCRTGCKKKKRSGGLLDGLTVREKEDRRVLKFILKKGGYEAKEGREIVKEFEGSIEVLKMTGRRGTQRGVGLNKD